MDDFRNHQRRRKKKKEKLLDEMLALELSAKTSDLERDEINAKFEKLKENMEKEFELEEKEFQKHVRSELTNNARQQQDVLLRDHITEGRVKKRIS